MQYVYLLILSNNGFYTGCTSDLKKRVLYHQKGKVASTKPYRPVQLFYYEAYLHKTDALVRELYLKTGNGRREIRKQLKHSLLSSKT